MHILDTPRACADCGRPAVKAYGSANTPLCKSARDNGYTARAARVREAAPAWRDKTDAPVWEPGERVL